MQSKPLQLDSPWPHRLAMVLAGLTFPLIWVGGLVTTYKAGMAVPDWPSTYGYNLFLYPWETWIYGPWDLFIEHGHRLLASLVGIVAISLVVVTLFREQRRWVRWAAGGALLLVIGQGVLGGARVMMDERTLAMVHACVGPAFFAFAVALCVITSRRWRAGETTELASAGKLQRLALVTTCLAYIQLVVGAQLRHVPVTASPDVFRVAIMFHLFLALVLVGHAAALAWIGCRRDCPAAVRRPLMALSVFLGGQLCLGVTTWVLKYGWPGRLAETRFAATQTILANGSWRAAAITAHVALGSLILAVCLVATLRSFRLLKPKTLLVGSTSLLLEAAT